MKYCRKCGSKMSEDAVFCSKCGCKFIEPEETDEIIKDTADKKEISSKTELYPEEYPTEEENTDMQLQNDLSARYSVEQNDINDNVPPLLKELSLMYEKIAKYSLATGIVEFLGAAVVILIGTAFIAQPERLLVPGIIFIIYGIGAAVTGLLNIIKFFKGNKFCKIIKSDPSQALEESLDIFMDENKYARLVKSTESLDTLNIFFRFYKDIKYAQKHEYIKAFIEENNKELSDIYSAYSAIDQGKEITDEMQKSLSSFPKTSYSNKLNLRIRTILTGICLIILIPVVIWLNKLMREPEYANYIGEKYGHTNTATQQNSKIQSYTAEEFINKYNELASYFDGVVDTFDYSTGKKEKHKDSLWIYSFSDSRKEKSLSLMVDCSSTSEKVVSVSMSFYISEDDDPVYRYDVANAITVFIKNLPLADASAACEQTVEKGEYTDSQIAGITLYYEKDSSYNTENWFILLSGEDSTTVQSSNQTDIKTEESSRVSEKETSTVQESEVSRVKETSKNDSNKTVYSQGIYDRVLEILYDDAYRDMDLEYAFGHLIGSDNLFMFVKHGYISSEYYNFYEITENSVSYVGKIEPGGHSELYINDKNQLCIGYFHQKYFIYGMLEYSFGRIDWKKNNSLEESKFHSEESVFQNYYNLIELVPARDLSLAKNIILGESEPDSEIEYPNEKLYSQKLFYYNGIIYYTPKFSGTGVSHGVLDFSELGDNYKPLPVLYHYYSDENSYREIDIDSFIIVNDVVYFTDQEPGSVSTPAKLYQMNLDGSCLCLLDEDVAVGFYYNNKTIYYTASIYSEYEISGSTYTYNISSKNKERDFDNGIDLSSADTIFNGQSPVSFQDGFYYRAYERVMVDDKTYYTVYYRMDSKTGEVQIVGYANPDFGGNL